MNDKKIIKLTLPFPPSLNSIYKIGRGNWYKIKAAQDYEWIVKQAFLATKMKGFEIDTLIKLTVDVYPATKRHFDLDNLMKVLGDSLQSARIIENDHQIRILHMENMSIAPKNSSSYIEITVEAIE